MDSMKDKVAIVGIGYTAQGKVPGRSSMSFHLEAARNAIADSGLKIGDVDGLLMQPPMEAMGDPMVAPPDLAQQLGIRVRFMAAHDVWGASAGCMAQHAAWAVVHGMANYVVCTYGERALSGASEYGAALNGGIEYGMFGAVAGYALGARRGIHDFGTGPETWKEIAIAQRQWANLNPGARYYEQPMTPEDYYNSRMIVEPFRRADICLVSDGGRAFIVTTAERARDCRHKPVYIMGMGQDHPSTNPPQAVHLAGPTGAVVSGAEAFRMAGVTRDDIDACEIYDCFTYTVELTLMGYGFFAPGEGRDFLKAERLAPGGDFPVNTSGGQLSEAYFQGFTPLAEAIMQLRGDACERQLGPVINTREPEIIMVSGNGGILQAHSTLILRR